MPAPGHTLCLPRSHCPPLTSCPLPPPPYRRPGYIDVPAGAYVRRGQFLGTIGDFRYGPTSNRFPPHLHFGARDGNALTYVRGCIRA